MGWVDTRGGRDRGGARPERGWPHKAAREEDTRGAKQKNEACPPPRPLPFRVPLYPLFLHTSPSTIARTATLNLSLVTGVPGV